MYRSSQQKKKNSKIQKISPNSRENSCIGIFFFNKDSGLRPATLLKKRLQQRFFLWILWSFEEHLLWRIPLFLIYHTVSFCKEVIYICSNLILLEKSTKTHNCGIFSLCKYILYSIYCKYILHYRSKHKHKKSCFINARILGSFYKKGKKLRNKNSKTRKSRKYRISRKSYSEFSILAVGQNSDLKISDKNFRDFRDFRGFRVFDLAIF